MLDVGLDKAVLFLGSRIPTLVEAIGSGSIMIVVAPLGLVKSSQYCKQQPVRDSYEVVNEFLSRNIGRCVFKVNDDQLLVLIRRVQQGRLSTGLQAEEVAVLSL